MILVVGLSPAWQRTLEFGNLAPGAVNRIRRVTETASGKGVNVARVASILGAKVKLLTVAGGARGRLLRSELKRQRLRARIVPVRSETRICQTLLARGVATELVEEAGPLNATEAQKVIRAFTAEVRLARLVVLTGTVPKGCGDDFYARVVGKANRWKVPVLIDAQHEQLVNTLRRKPFLVRINRHELAAATNIECGGRTGVLRALTKLMRGGLPWAVISDGSKSIYSRDKSGKRLQIHTPPRVKVENPIGSGDAMLAGIAVGLTRGRSVPEAIRFGIACGAANAKTAEPGWVRPTDVQNLFRR